MENYNIWSELPDITFLGESLKQCEKGFAVDVSLRKEFDRYSRSAELALLTAW